MDRGERTSNQMQRRHFVAITKQSQNAEFRISPKWLALFASFVLGLICAVTLANDLPDNIKKEFVTDFAELEHDDE